MPWAAIPVNEARPAPTPAKAPPGTPFGEHWHFRGHIPGYVPATLVTGFGSPCGMCFYEGGAFGPKYAGAPLHTDSGPREVRVYRHEPKGFGMTATERAVELTQAAAAVAVSRVGST